MSRLYIWPKEGAQKNVTDVRGEGEGAPDAHGEIDEEGGRRGKSAAGAAATGSDAKTATSSAAADAPREWLADTAKAGGWDIGSDSKARAASA